MGKSESKAKDGRSKELVINMVRNGQIWDFLDRLDMRCGRRAV